MPFLVLLLSNESNDYCYFPECDIVALGTQEQSTALREKYLSILANERKEVPEPIVAREADPLGSNTIPHLSFDSTIETSYTGTSLGFLCCHLQQLSVP